NTADTLYTLKNNLVPGDSLNPGSFSKSEYLIGKNVGTQCLEVGDLDADDKPEIIIGHNQPVSYITVYKNNSTAQSISHTIFKNYRTEIAPVEIRMSDM